MLSCFHPSDLTLSSDLALSSGPSSAGMVHGARTWHDAVDEAAYYFRIFDGRRSYDELRWLSPTARKRAVREVNYPLQNRRHADWFGKARRKHEHR